MCVNLELSAVVIVHVLCFFFVFMLYKIFNKSNHVDIMVRTVSFRKEILAKKGEGAIFTKGRAELRLGFASASGLLRLRDPTDRLNNFANSASKSVSISADL